ncbi:MAG TPA: response regulator, partial [Clostridia bacterium]|nr:response regulator [Clostridia bacterium]
MNTSAPEIPRLLVVEDDSGLAFLLSGLLGDIGLQCDTASSGQQALSLFGANSFALILLDYALPDMAANELIALARTRGQMPPFIVLTGNGDERIAVELMKQGARDYLIKDA